MENEGRCPVCGRAVALTPQRRLVKVHQTAGARCPGTGRQVRADQPAPPLAAEREAASTPLVGERPPPPPGTAGSGRRGWLVAVLVLGAVLAIAGIVGGDSETPSTAAENEDAAATTLSEAAPSTAAEDEDTSVQDFLDAAGVGAALVRRLGEVAGDTGYGLTRGVPMEDESARGFAMIQVTTCRELASGYRTLEEIVASDIANGAPEGDARTMAAFLRDSFCPAVEPLTQDTSAPTPGAAAPPSDGTRGLMSSVEYLDATLPAGSVADCAAVTGQPFGEPRAYVLPGGQLLCGDFTADGPWGPHFIHLDVVFPTPVPAEQALPVVTSLMPEDLGPADTREGGNPPYAPAPGGCLSVVWPSQIMGDVVARINPDWGPENEASAVLYSDRQTSDGSSAPFDGTVRVASLGSGGHNDVSGPVIC